MKLLLQLQAYSLAFGPTGEWFYYGPNDFMRIYRIMLYLGPFRIALELKNKREFYDKDERLWLTYQ